LATTAVAVAVPAAIPIAAEAFTLHQYWGPGCLNPGKANGVLGPKWKPATGSLQASTSGFPSGCSATNAANVGALVKWAGSYPGSYSVTNPNGYVETGNINGYGWSMWPGCFNHGAHKHKYQCYSDKSPAH
jgi:hypothetical protein